MTALRDLEAERAILGAVMFDPRILERVALKPEHFSEPIHAETWAELTARAGRGLPLDPGAMRDWANERCAAVGGVAYLVDLIEPGSGASFNAAYYAEGYADILRDLAHKRAAQTMFRAAANDLERADLLEVLSAVEGEVRSLGNDGRASADLTDAAGDLIANLDKPRLSTGIASLDRRIGGLFPNDLIVLAGRPSMGKTTLATQISRNVAAGGKVVHFASLDMSREQMAARALSAASRAAQSALEHIEYFHIRNGSNVDRRLLERLAQGLPKNLIVDDAAAQTLSQLEQSARATRRRMKGLDLIVVDYLQLMTAKRTDGRVHEVSEISAGLKAIAKRLGVPVLALSQLSRGVEGRENKRPTLSDLRDSGAIEQDADIVLGVYREAYYLERTEPNDQGAEWAKWRADCARLAHELEIITLKQRQGPIGTDRVVAHLAFDTVLDRGAT